LDFNIRVAIVKMPPKTTPAAAKAPAKKSPVTKTPATKKTTTNAPPRVPEAVKRKKKDDLGAGLRISKTHDEEHPAGPPRFGELTQAERAFTLASTFLSGVLA
jgi:hypothetical protein